MVQFMIKVRYQRYYATVSTTVATTLPLHYAADYRDASIYSNITLTTSKIWQMVEKYKIWQIIA